MKIFMKYLQAIIFTFFQGILIGVEAVLIIPHVIYELCMSSYEVLNDLTVKSFREAKEDEYCKKEKAVKAIEKTVENLYPF